MPMSILDELIHKLSLERLEVNLYRGESEDPGWGIVYGGHAHRKFRHGEAFN